MSYPVTFGKYLLLERINVGGMAEVFKAKAFGVEGFERILAVKRILPTMAEDDEFINMFIDEAHVAVQLSHPNIVPIYELGKFDSQYYIAMEYVPGKDFRQILDRFRKRNETLPVPAAAYVVSKVCEGLDYAHRKSDPSGRALNVIHRDVSPQNILVGFEGAVKITDFGIVKAEDRASKTQAGVLKGKFGYMSPEQVRGLEIDRRSDVFAVGILLYEALTGKRLFIGESDFSTLEKVRNAEVVPPSQHNPAVGEALEQVVLRALARERDERYQWAIELYDDLQPFLLDEGAAFNATKLTAMLRDEYRDEIALEQQKMEEFMHMRPPSSAADAMSVAAQMRATPTGDWNDNRAEKTMIFDSGFDALAGATQVGSLESLSPGLVLPDAVPTSEPMQPTSNYGSRRVFMAAGALLVILLVVAGFFLLDRGGAVGTLVVTSQPIDTVDVIMDGELIGQKTPLIYPNVSVGEHTLLARAPGFADRAYRFDLMAGAPAQIKIELERTQALSASVGGEALLEITSEPTLAAVRLGGVPQGSTPYTMTLRDTSHPIILELVKTGYLTQQVTVSLAPGEKRKTINIKLLPSGNGESLPMGVNPARLTVHSRPEGALIYLNGTERGLTPRDIVDLDPRQSYALEITKDGFHPFEQTVHIGSRPSMNILATLSPERRRRSGGVAAGASAPTATVCGGTGGKLSVMPIDVSDCKVTVGKSSLGGAPIFRKESPVGRCPIEVKCPDGKRYAATRNLRAGIEEKIIIKIGDWQ